MLDMEEPFCQEHHITDHVIYRWLKYSKAETIKEWEPGRHEEVISAHFAITSYRHEKLYQAPAAQNNCQFLALTSHTTLGQTKDWINHGNKLHQYTHTTHKYLLPYMPVLISNLFTSQLGVEARQTDGECLECWEWVSIIHCEHVLGNLTKLQDHLIMIRCWRWTWRLGLLLSLLRWFRGHSI